MKKFIITLIILVIIYIASYLYFGGFFVGYRNNHFIIYTYTCADVCPQQGLWYTKYYGDISQDLCVSLGGEPKFVGFIPLDSNGKPVTGIGYDGCKVN